MRRHRREREKELMNTASWIYASTGADMDTCMNEAANLLASLSDGDDDGDPRTDRD